MKMLLFATYNATSASKVTGRHTIRNVFKPVTLRSFVNEIINGLKEPKNIKQRNHSVTEILLSHIHHVESQRDQIDKNSGSNKSPSSETLLKIKELVQELSNKYACLVKHNFDNNQSTFYSIQTLQGWIKARNADISKEIADNEFSLQENVSNIETLESECKELKNMMDNTSPVKFNQRAINRKDKKELSQRHKNKVKQQLEEKQKKIEANKAQIQQILLKQKELGINQEDCTQDIQKSNCLIQSLQTSSRTKPLSLFNQQLLAAHNAYIKRHKSILISLQKNDTLVLVKP